MTISDDELSQWEADYKNDRADYSDSVTNDRILSLIAAIRQEREWRKQKDAKLDIIIKSQYSKDHLELTARWAAAIMIARDARALGNSNKEFRKENK